ncbi:hypothetical protein ACS0TY_012202 [Phlomoides rotata]
MSNNLVSQYPMPDRHVTQMEHDPNSLDLPVSGVPMKMAGQPESHHIYVSTDQSVPMKMAGQPQSSDPGFSTSIVGEHTSFPVKRKAEVEHQSSNSTQQFPLPNKRPTHVRSNVSSHGFLQSPPSQRKTVQLQSKLGSSAQPLPNKKMMRNDSMSSKSGVQRGQAGKKQTAQIESPKVRPESSEGVRSKMRESLAAALALAYRKQDNAPNTEKNLNDANITHQAMDSQASKISNSTGEGQVPVSGSEEVFPSNELTALNKTNDCQVFSTELPANGNGGSGGQAFQGFQYSLPDDDVPFGDNFFGKDDLLQGNGLSWAFEFDVMGEGKEAQHDEKTKSVKEETQGHRGEIAILTPDNMASQIEAELFKLFGDVNKKYREKGRSLIFNLKDRNNPELRERVMSGEISPERLCSMSGEELASKELSEWRMAKAEELAQMKVLPDTEVDIRRLVRKTHKGEFQVEVEHDDGMAAEVSGGASMLTQSRPKKDIESQSPSNASLKDKEKSDGQDFSGSLVIPTDGTDLMQGIIVDELKDAEFLPPIVSLDEFMESLNNEPPFENLAVDAGPKSPISHGVSPKSVSNFRASNRASDNHKDTSSKKADVAKKNDATMKSSGSPAKKIAVPSVIPKPDYIWDGVLQLSISSLVTVGGLFRSGEKTSTKEWPLSLEIKGRVRIDAFEKFLQELPMSRTRAVMILHFVLKDKSIDEQRSNFSEAIDSYTTDERLGYAEPLPGVELYLCPPTSRMFDMLNKFMPKDRPETTSSFENGLIGVVVWRRAHISNTISPNSSSHHKHTSKKQPFATPTRVQDSPNVNANTPTQKPDPNKDDDDDDDVPPGFGPGVVKDDDDLPEFNFSGNLNPSGPRPSLNTVKKTSRPVDEVRELIKKYGQSSNSTVTGSVLDNRNLGIEPWNDDDDDIPEWRPQAPQPPQQLLFPAAQLPVLHTTNQRVVTQLPHTGLGHHPPPGAARLQPPGHLRGPRWRQY